MASVPSARVGAGVETIDTPALVIDLDAMERNLRRMAEFARAHGVALRPHAKMHKSVDLARRQLAAGAVGVCVQKTAEAEVMADGGIDDIFLSNQVVSVSKLARVATVAHRLARRGGRLSIAVDSPLGIELLSGAMAAVDIDIDVFVEIDVGQGRCGVAPGEPALALARRIAAAPKLRFGGLQAYHGGAQHVRAVQDRRERIARVVAAVGRTQAVLAAAGLRAPLVTGAGTGTFALEAASGVFGELQAGSYLFMDADYALNERASDQPEFEHALFVKTQVVSVADDHAVCDAGHKAHAVDSGLPCVWQREIEVVACSDEAATLRGATLPQLGEALWLIPGHCDPTVNLHDAMVGVRGGLAGGVVERIVNVDARGALS